MKRLQRKLLRKYIFSQKKRIVLLFAFKLMNSSFEAGISLLVYFFTEDISRNTNLKNALFYCLFAAVFITVGSLALGIDLYLTNKVTCYGLMMYKNDLFERILNVEDDEKTSVSSESLTLIQKDLIEIKNSFFNPWLSAISYSFTFIFAVAISFYLNLWIALILLACSVILAFIPLLYGRNLAKQRASLSDENLKYSSFLDNSFKGKRIINNAKTQKNFINYNEVKTREIEKKENRLWVTYGYENGLAYFLIMLLEVGSFFIGGILYIQNLTSLATAVAIFSLSSKIYNPLTQIISSIVEIKSTNKLITKVEEIPKPALLEEGAISIFDPILTIRGLTIGYDTKIILFDIHLTINIGEKVLISGESGSGKTTLFECLLGYKKPISGEFFWGGTSNSSSDIVSYCPQSPYLFLGTLKDNITLFSKECDEDKLNDVIHACALEKFLENRGLNEPLNEFDSKISLGEMQRISLARALYLDRPVLLLDEVTSALDKENTKLIMNTLNNIEGKTIILISHYLELIEEDYFTKHYAIENKKLVDRTKK